MNHEIIKRIQELVPDVMKLEFGCEVVLYSEEYSKNSKILKVLDKRHISGIDTIVEVCENNSNGVSHVSYVAKNELKILGKPITIGVALMAIAVKMNMKPVNRGGELIDMWDLSKDNFNDQSDETKAFIGGLLN